MPKSVNSNNPIAPKIFITKDGHIVGNNKMLDPTLGQGSGFEKNFFYHNNTNDMIVFDSIWAYEYFDKTHASTAQGNIYTTRYKIAFKAYVEGNTVHANGVKITFDGPPLVLALGGDDIKCEAEGNGLFKLVHNIDTPAPDGMKLGYYSKDITDSGLYEEWLMAFKLEGRKVIKIEAPQNSCNLYVDGNIYVTDEAENSVVSIDFGALQDVVVSQEPTGAAASSQDASAHSSADGAAASSAVSSIEDAAAALSTSQTISSSNLEHDDIGLAGLTLSAAASASPDAEG